MDALRKAAEQEPVASQNTQEKCRIETVPAKGGLLSIHPPRREWDDDEIASLRAEVERLRELIWLGDAEWLDKHIYPVGGAAHQNWLVRVYLPVPLSAKDKSPEAALERALKRRKK